MPVPPARDVGADGDWLDRVRNEQHQLATRLASTLAGQLLEKVPVEAASLRATLGLPVDRPVPDVLLADPQALRPLLEADLEHDCIEGLIGLTDWMAVAIVRGALRDVPVPARGELAESAIFEHLPQEHALPVPGESDLKRIGEGYGPSVLLLSQLRELMGKEKHLPMLGVNRRGLLEVDRRGLARWGAGYDWGL